MGRTTPPNRGWSVKEDSENIRDFLKAAWKYYKTHAQETRESTVRSYQVNPKIATTDRTKEDTTIRDAVVALGSFIAKGLPPPAWIKNLVTKVDNDIGDDKRFIEFLKATVGTQFRTLPPLESAGYRKGGTVKRKRSKLRKGGAIKRTSRKISTVRKGGAIKRRKKK